MNTSYGTFGSSNIGFDLSYGGDKWGNFIAANALDTGRFLDPPEFVVMHDKGNEENIFDRVDYQFSTKDSIHLNLGFSRSWFQTPNSYDSQNATPWNGVSVSNNGLGPNGIPVGPADQRSKIDTFNIAPTWTRAINATTVISFGGFVRRDGYNYYPSNNPFADLGPPNLQQQTISQYRTLANTVRPWKRHPRGWHRQHQGGSYVSTDLSQGKLQPRNHRPKLQRPMPGCQWRTGICRQSNGERPG